MPKITFNKPYAWISQDDIVAQPWQIIEGNNITWLRTWYGWTLWPKPIKQINTNEAMYWMTWQESNNWDVSRMYVWWVNGVIYRISWTDLVPVYTLPSGNNILWAFQFNGYHRFTVRLNAIWTNYQLARISHTDEVVNNWAWLVENVIPAGRYSIWTPSVVIYWNSVYLWSLRGVSVIDSWDIATSVSFWADYVTWLTLQWTTIKVYYYNWQVYYWNWDTTQSFSSVQDLWKWIREVSTQGRFDHLIFNDGSSRISAWYQDQEISSRVFSNRLTNNTIYETKFSLAPPLSTATWWNASVLGKYFLSNDTEAGIYQYDKLISWMAKSFHKILTTSSQWIIDELTFIYLHKRFPTPRIYFGYRSWTKYWVDYIDEWILTTTQSWYFITDVIRWIPNEINRVIKIKMTTSYTSWNNFVKLWKRINNWSWVLVRTINNATDTIAVEEINDITDNFIDIQLKVELWNDLQTDTPPIVHDFSLDFDQV